MAEKLYTENSPYMWAGDRKENLYFNENTNKTL